MGGFTDDWSCDLDTWGYFEVLDTLKSMGYLALKELWYVVDRRLQLLYDDNGSINMFNVSKGNGEVHLYVVNIVSEAVVVDDDLESNLEYAIVEVNAELGGGGLTKVVLGGRGETVGELGGRGENEADLGGGGETEFDMGGGGETKDDLGGGGETDLGGGGEEDLGVGREDEFHANLGGGGGQEGVFETEVEIEVEVHSWVDLKTGDEDFVNVPISVMGAINNCYNDVGFVAVEVGITEEENESECEQRGDVRKHFDRGLYNDQWQSYKLSSDGETDCESEDDDSNQDVFGMFVMTKSMADYKWDVGTYFLDKEQFRDVVRTYAIHGGRNIRFVKNDKHRVRVRRIGVQGNCPWLVIVHC